MTICLFSKIFNSNWHQYLAADPSVRYLRAALERLDISQETQMGNLNKVSLNFAKDKTCQAYLKKNINEIHFKYTLVALPLA